MTRNRIIITSLKMLVCLAFLGGFVSACTTGGALPAGTIDAPFEKDGYVLGMGDKIRLTVYNQPALSGEFVVDPTGKLALPLITEIKAAGRTVRELEDNITDALQPKYLQDPKVSIEVLEYRDIYVLGEVRSPGTYAYVPYMTVQQAIAVAGGHTFRAKENSAEITRQTPETLDTFDVPNKTFIRPGDTIVVERRWF